MVIQVAAENLLKAIQKNELKEEDASALSLILSQINMITGQLILPASIEMYSNLLTVTIENSENLNVNDATALGLLLISIDKKMTRDWTVAVLQKADEKQRTVDHVKPQQEINFSIERAVRE